MHFYQFNVKDYASATAHLTVEEDCCYRRLLDLYYDQEAPFDSQNIYWLARRVRISAEIVQTILDEFFDLIDGFYTNSRANHEIETYQAMKKGGKKGSDKRWHKGEDSPPIATPIAPLSPTHATPNANHEPITINQVNLEALSDSQANTDPIEPEVKKADYIGSAKRILEFLNLRTAKNYRPVASNLSMIVARLKEGYTEQEMRTVTMRKVNEWGTDEKMGEYLRPKTLYNATNFNSYAGILT